MYKKGRFFIVIWKKMPTFVLSNCSIAVLTIDFSLKTNYSFLIIIKCGHADFSVSHCYMVMRK